MIASSSIFVPQVDSVSGDSTAAAAELSKAIVTVASSTDATIREMFGDGISIFTFSSISSKPVRMLLMFESVYDERC